MFAKVKLNKGKLKIKDIKRKIDKRKVAIE